MVNLSKCDPETSQSGFHTQFEVSKGLKVEVSKVLKIVDLVTYGGQQEVLSYVKRD